jgi:S-adenosylmethionine synthetase
MTAALYPAEFVFPGHPDKLCDAIADALVQEAIRREPRALVGVEVAVHRDHVYMTGRIACTDAADIDVEGIVRDVYRSAGYDQDWYPSPEQVKVVSNLCLGPLEDCEAEFRELSDDQAICVGYANDLQATNHLPVEQWLVVRLARRLHALRLEAPKLGLGPDGKVLIGVREETGAADRRWALEAFSCSLQQKVRADDVALHRAVRLAVEEEISRAAHELVGFSPRLPDSLTVNGAGAFEVGGPEGDNGLSGKKLVVDAYGPRVPIGGGAWSGKDFFKADRAGGLHARRLAKAIVRLGLAREAQVVLGWFPGDRSGRVLRIETGDGEAEEDGVVEVDRLENTFNLSLLRSGMAYPAHHLVEVARWGHFADQGHAWERIEGL